MINCGQAELIHRSPFTIRVVDTSNFQEELRYLSGRRPAAETRSSKQRKNSRW
jgi:hypothetical protein